MKKSIYSAVVILQSINFFMCNAMFVCEAVKNKLFSQNAIKHQSQNNELQYICDQMPGLAQQIATLQLSADLEEVKKHTEHEIQEAITCCAMIQDDKYKKANDPEILPLKQAAENLLKCGCLRAQKKGEALKKLAHIPDRSSEVQESCAQAKQVMKKIKNEELVVIGPLRNDLHEILYICHQHKRLIRSNSKDPRVYYPLRKGQAHLIEGWKELRENLVPKQSDQSLDE